MSAIHTAPRTRSAPRGKRATNLTLSADVLEAAKAMDINISQLCDAYLRDVVRRGTGRAAARARPFALYRHPHILVAQADRGWGGVGRPWNSGSCAACGCSSSSIVPDSRPAGL